MHAVSPQLLRRGATGSSSVAEAIRKGFKKEVGCVLIMKGWDLRLADRAWEQARQGKSWETAAASAARKGP